MYSKILVAIDGSSASEKALKTAVVFAQAYNAELYIFHAANQGIHAPRGRNSPPGISDPAVDKVTAILVDEGEEIIESAKKVVKDANCTIKTKVRAGDPVDLTLQYADEINADLIIVGSTGKGMAKRLLIGSVSSAVVSASKRSVLVVK